ncbi:MAG: hypothetical protein FWC47_02835 [Oscillospiraceae bacterium]|nr:hypothetical protein [Oscillospiraceae bacterium]
MPDYGDEFGSQMTSTAQSLLQTWLQRKGYTQTKSVIQGNEEFIGIPFESNTEMSAAYSMVREYDIKCHKDVTEDGALTLMITKNDSQRAERVLEQLHKEVTEKIFNNSSQTNEVDNDLPDDYIKSHDSIDVNVNTLNVEHGDLEQHRAQRVQWKDELTSIIKEVREEARDEQDFIERLNARGVKTIDATDGEFLFIHPSSPLWEKNGRERYGWQIRGETLDKEEGVNHYSRKSFKDKGYDLESECKDARIVSKIMAEEAEKDAPERFQKVYQQLTK